ncbi:MAG: DUF4160 domain-containing protein [Betaproteobacteria bacterium]|nr:DUF4160 domain-containing protein [Betaproteobacteria bacterium]
MPVVFRHKGFRFFFFSNEGNPREPIHIHVMKDGIDAKTQRELVEVIEHHADDIERVWNEHFG